MKIFNQIQRGKLQERLARGLGIQERSPAPTLAGDVQAVVLLEDLTRPTPFLQPRDRSCAGRVLTTAVVGETGLVTLSSNVGGSTIVRVRRLILGSGTAGRFNWGYADNIEATPELALFKDKRNEGIPAALLRSGTDPIDLVANKLGSVQMSTSTGTVQIDDMDIMLIPQVGGPIADVFAVQFETSNVAVTISIEWTEYDG